MLSSNRSESIEWGFRLQDSTSMTKYDPKSGFTANHKLFTPGAVPMTENEYESYAVRAITATAPIELKLEIQDHILGWSRNGEPVKPSRWISLATDLNKVLLEAVRRLRSRAHKASSVKVYAIALSRDGDTTIDRLRLLRPARYPSDIHSARRLANWASEKLVLGRIFPREIVELGELTLEVSSPIVPDPFMTKGLTRTGPGADAAGALFQA
jgi:hypothetical protein